MADIPLVDQGFYGNGINCYKEGLKTVGVMFEYGEAYEFMGRHRMSLVAFSALTKSRHPYPPCPLVCLLPNSSLHSSCPSPTIYLS